MPKKEKTPKNLKVLEFKPRFTPEQIQLIDKWLEPSRYIWNIALSEFEKLDLNFRWHKESKSYYAVSALTWDIKYVYLNSDGSSARELSRDERQKAIAINAYRETPDGIEWFSYDRDLWLSHHEIGKHKIKYLAPCSQILNHRSIYWTKFLPVVRMATTERGRTEDSIYTSAELSWMRGWKGEDNCTGYSCPIYLWNDPVFHNTSFTGGDSPSRVVKREILQELIERNLFAKNGGYPDIIGIPYEYAQGIIKNLCVSWQEYIKSRSGASQIKRGRPKYKSANDAIDTLASGKSNTSYISGKDEIKLPGLGAVKVTGLSDRWINNDSTTPEKINTFKIVRRASGYYLQLTGEIKRSPKLLKNPDKATGIDPGLKSYLVHADGREVENPRYLRNTLEKIKKLQRQLNAKLTHNLIMWICNPVRTIQDVKEVCPSLSDKQINNLLGLKTKAEIVEAIGPAYTGKLERIVGYSNRCKAIEKHIKRLHEKVKAQRKAFIEKQSTWIIRKHEAIVIEDGMQSANLRRKAKPKFNKEKNSYDRNNAKAKSGLSKSLADGGHGAFISALERKAEGTNRDLIKHPARGTTQNCPICENEANIDLSVRWYACKVCGYEGDRDRKSGIYMLVHSYLRGSIKFEQLPEVVQKAIGDREQWDARNSSSKTEKTPRKRKKKTE